MAKYTKETITSAGWQCDGNTWSEVQALATVRAADRMELAAGRLQAIIERLDLLGREGLHEIVKELARGIRVKRKRRLARRRAARRRLKVVGSAA